MPLGALCLALFAGCSSPAPTPQVPTASLPDGPSQAASVPVASAPATSPMVGATRSAGPYDGLPQKLQQLLESANTLVKSPGMAMGVQIGTQFTWVGAAGVRNLTDKTPMQPGDQFRIGSVSKNFLGTCVLQLIGEKKIALTDTLEKWLPGVMKHIDGTKITVQNLLQHTSGIPDYTHDEDLFMKVYQTPPGYTFDAPTQILAAADGLQVKYIAQKDTLPIGPFNYSSTNYILLAMIATKADGIPNYDWQAMIKKRIFDRVELPSTSIPLRGVQTIPDGNQHAYVNWQNFLGMTAEECTKLTPQCQNFETEFTKQDTSAPWSTGSIISTVGDLVKFMGAEMRGTLLSTELLKVQQQFMSVNDPNRPYLSVGLSIYEDSPYKLIGHRGAISGFNSTLQYQKDKDTIIVVLSNRSPLDNKGVEDVPEAAFKIMFPDFPVPGQAPAPQAAPRKLLGGKLHRALKRFSPMREY